MATVGMMTLIMKRSRCPPADDDPPPWSRWMDNEQRAVFVFCCFEKTLSRSSSGRKVLISTNSPGQEFKGTWRKKKPTIPSLLLWSQRKAPVKFPWMEPHCNYNSNVSASSLKVPCSITILPRAVFQEKQVSYSARFRVFYSCIWLQPFDHSLSNFQC